LQLPPIHPEVHAFLVAPVASPANVYGWICLVGNEGRLFTDEDEALLMALSGQIGRIYENGYFYTVAQTERDRAERYLDAAETILLALDVDGRITLVNRYACDLLGWTADELIGRDFIETCVPAPIRLETSQKRHHAQGADESIVENPIFTRSGDERLIEWRTSFLRNAAGAITGTLSSGTDITDRRRAELRIRHERDRAQRFLDTADVILLALDTDGRITLINRKGCELLGWPESELLGRDWIETCVPVQARDARREKFQDALRAGFAAGESQVLTRSGEVRLIEWRSNVVRDDGGHVTATFSSGTDVTERDRAIGALRTAEERMRFVLENADVGIWDMDYTTGVLRWSEILETHYGLGPGTFPGTFEAFIASVHPDDRASVLATLDGAMQTGSDFSVKHRSVWPDGTIRWLSGTGRMLLGDHGQAVRAVGISMDVTERRTLEEQYQQAQKMEAVGRLAGGVAHDFNNLLTVILGYCELLLTGTKAGDPQLADITEIQKAGARAGALTRQLLAFSRKQIIEPTLLDLNVIANDMQAMIGRLIGEDVKIVLALRPELRPVRADRGQIEQILMNLAVNARDAMPQGGTLTIETANVELDQHYAITHREVEPGPYVVLVVSDTGTGMTPEIQARMFEPFFTTKEPGKGTGLGMATIFGIATQAGGTVGVYSEVGRGTSIKVYFPMSDAEMTADVPLPAARPQAGTQTVLVVEDEDGLRALATKLLQRQGYTVLAAANAEEACRLFASHPSIDVLLTDVVMPGASGPELTRKLVEQRPALRVIYMSGYTEEGIVHHGVLKPGIAFLHKPFTSQTLGQKIRDVLER
jgi:two-component system, cell cycle sensor histidine kinase and response regulator CckA